MNDPQITGAIISLLGLIATAIIGGMFALFKQSANQRNGDDKMVDTFRSQIRNSENILGEVRSMREDMREILLVISNNQKEVMIELIRQGKLGGKP